FREKQPYRLIPWRSGLPPQTKFGPWTVGRLRSHRAGASTTTSRVTRELAIEKFPKSSIDRILKRSTAMRRNIGKPSGSFLLVLCALLLGSRASGETQSPFITIDAPGAGTAETQ